MFAEMRFEFKSDMCENVFVDQVDSDIQDCCITSIEIEGTFHQGEFYKLEANEYHVTFKIPVTEQAYFAVKFLKTDSYKVMI